MAEDRVANRPTLESVLLAAGSNFHRKFWELQPYQLDKLQVIIIPATHGSNYRRKKKKVLPSLSLRTMLRPLNFPPTLVVYQVN